MQQRDKIDYERANQKPQEFIEKFEKREVTQKKVKRGAKSGSYTYTEKKRLGQGGYIETTATVINDVKRTVILKSKQ